VFFFFTIFAIIVNGQEFINNDANQIIVWNAQSPISNAYSSKWQTRVNVGTNIPITKLLQGTNIDNLFEYDDNSFYWQILSLTYFFNRHWGLEFNYQAGTSSRLRKKGNNYYTNRIESFIKNMHSEFDEIYYIRSMNMYGTHYDDFNFFRGDIKRGFFGVIYRLETDKIYLYPKLSFGTISFYTDWFRANLKEKNSNNEFEIYVSSVKIPNVNEYLTIIPSVSFGYKITNRLYFNSEIKLSYFKPDIEIKKELTNLFTKESTVEYFDYKNNIFTLSLGTVRPFDCIILYSKTFKII